MESSDNDEDHAAPKYITTSNAQCILGNSKGAQYAVKKARSTQAQCAARKSMSIQSEAKEFDNEDNRRVVKKKTVSESKNKKPPKNCIIL